MFDRAVCRAEMSGVVVEKCLFVQCLMYIWLVFCIGCGIDDAPVPFNRIFVFALTGLYVVSLLEPI